LLPISGRPHVINPQQGWLTNWNNIPSQGWTTGNDPASERVAGPFFRTAFLNNLVRRFLVRQQPSFPRLQRTVQHEGSTAEQRSLAAPELRRAAAVVGGLSDGGSQRFRQTCPALPLERSRCMAGQAGYVQ